MKRIAWAELLARYAQLRRRHRLPALAALPVVLALGAYVALFADQRAQREGLDAALNQAAAQRAEREAVVANAAGYGERLHALEQQLRAAHAVLPDEAEVPQFLAQLGTMAHDVGLQIERFEPKPEQTRDFYAELGFHVQVRGSFHQIVAFIAQIGNMERIVDVSNVNMAADKTEVQKAGVDGAFDLRIFRLMTDAQIEAAKAAREAGGKK